MGFDPVRYVRTRSREEWQQIVVERWTEARIWIQENGEKAAVVALAAGIALVIFYKVVLVLLALGAALGCAAWNIALPADSRIESSQPPPEITGSSEPADKGQ